MHITHALGGVQTYLEYILNYSDKEKFEFIIVAPHHDTFQSFCKPIAKYHPLNIKREINIFGDIGLLFKLIFLIKKEKPDVLHVHSAKGGFLGRLAGKFSSCKIVYTPHGFSYLSFTGIKRMCFFLLECIARNWSHLLLAVSHSEAKRAIFEIGYKKDKIQIILNSIKADLDLKPKNYDSNFRIGMIGRLTPQKNPLLFLEIATALLQKYPFLKFAILGAGLNDSLGRELKEFIVQRNLQASVSLLPWGNGATSQSFINETDIFVMTSVFEGLPYSLLEAMGGGCACVVSKADGNSDVIQNNENGFACLTTEEFCKRIEALVCDKELREKTGKAARKYVLEKHEICCAINQLELLYADINVL